MMTSKFTGCLNVPFICQLFWSEIKIFLPKYPVAGYDTGKIYPGPAGEGGAEQSRSAGVVGEDQPSGLIKDHDTRRCRMPETDPVARKKKSCSRHVDLLHYPWC